MRGTARLSTRLRCGSFLRLALWRPVHQARRHNMNSSVEGLRDTAAESVHVGKAHCAPFPRRTHTCKSLSSDCVDSRVVLTGWLLAERKVNKRLSFFNLRDPYGTVQLVVAADASNEVLSKMREVPMESTVLLEGTIRMRAKEHQRPYAGGDIEVVVESFTLVNPADSNLPFMPDDARNLANEHLRLRYRYLDLRRNALSSNLKKRSEVAHIIRGVFHEQEFMEVETPILLKSTPEGAREFLVPTRIIASSPPNTTAPLDALSHPLFYALPQSPQQPKQLLVASGAVDRYYQLARCFRDEDGRKDRQPEFTQVDLEMAWVSWGDPAANATSRTEGTSPPSALPEPANSWRIGGHEVRDIVEKLVRRIWSESEGIQLEEHFEVMTYDTAMGRYGSDKPDLRFGLEIEDLTLHLPNTIREALASRGETIEALIVRKSSAADSAFLRAAKKLRLADKAASERIEIAANAEATWIGRSRTVCEILESGRDAQEESGYNINDALDLNQGATIWLSRRHCKPEGGSTALGRVRLELAGLAQSLGDLALPSDPRFLWVTEFPLFTHADADKEFLAHGRWSSSHHPFTAPMWQDVEKMYAGKIDEVRGQHYDLVLNGVEIGGGSVRIHDAAMQEYIFTQILQLDDTEKSSFDHLLHALRCGAPPHGGFAFGFDRLMAILCKAESIRDVIAFPKTGAGTDLLFKSPAPASPSVLAQYGIRPQ